MKPKVTVNCVAGKYAAREERIVEFIDPKTGNGGLISFSRDDDGKLIVAPYNCSGVEFRLPATEEEA